MTVIAWDGETLAGDRKQTIGDTPMRARKVYRVRSYNGAPLLLGMAGDSFGAEAFKHWLETGERPDDVNMGEYYILCIDQARNVWYRNEQGVYLKLNVKQMAIGCGADFALGAMAHGATAVEAVKIASKLDVYCGMGVDAVRF